MSLSIKNKVALVTGANRGIGKAIVESFLAHGADKVYLAVRNPETTTDLARTYGERVVTLPVDMSNAESIASLAQHARDVQVVVNNAGVLEIADPLCDHVEAALEAEITVNVLGLIRVAKAFAPILEANGGGALIATGNTSAYRGKAKFAGFAPTKAAQRILLESIAREAGPNGVHVAYVAIDAVIDLAWTREAFPNREDDFFCQPADIANEVLRIAEQPRSAWAFESVIRPYAEVW